MKNSVFCKKIDFFEPICNFLINIIYISLMEKPFFNIYLHLNFVFYWCNFFEKKIIPFIDIRITKGTPWRASFFLLANHFVEAISKKKIVKYWLIIWESFQYQALFKFSNNVNISINMIFVKGIYLMQLLSF